ncbi:hypothetical protein A0H81_11537 [Grifola frondosa]|uniref:NAD-dependent epimerase/dehydratase domain-containing protein n=1 Tax=Grifola frondosa TaxID=5627 RepID=A0A1C7LV59_GRIFR|nr:hypothetical protein A0H81_11537 [Grifola frondosa]
MSNNKTILVTGVSGYLGSHVVDQLVEAGYRVRGAARSGKIPFVKEACKIYGDRFEAVAIDDLIAGDFTEALKGVDAVIHVAAPLVEGGLNILRQGEKAGISKFVIVSSIAAVRSAYASFEEETGWTDVDWNPVTKEEALKSPDSFYVYSAAKTLAERAVWDFVDEHPHIDVTTVNPPFFFGPFAPCYTIPDATLKALKTNYNAAKLSAFSTNYVIYDLLRPDGVLMFPFAWSIDVRDVARGLVSALASRTDVGRKRILMTAEWYSWKDAAEWISAAHPELKGRLSKAARSAGPAPTTKIDNARAREVLGLVPRPSKQTLLDAVDQYIALEKKWASKGYNLQE